jgi:hypothetical protein
LGIADRVIRGGDNGSAVVAQMGEAMWDGPFIARTAIRYIPTCISLCILMAGYSYECGSWV